MKVRYFRVWAQIGTTRVEDVVELSQDYITSEGLVGCIANEIDNLIDTGAEEVDKDGNVLEEQP